MYMYMHMHMYTCTRDAHAELEVTYLECAVAGVTPRRGREVGRGEEHAPHLHVRMCMHAHMHMDEEEDGWAEVKSMHMHQWRLARRG